MVLHKTVHHELKGILKSNHEKIVHQVFLVNIISRITQVKQRYIAEIINGNIF